jgi:hypothetical protein
MSDLALKDRSTTISCDQALKIARADAQAVYRDLSIYRTSISLEENGWVIDYELKDLELQGGGPHYLIDGETGEILWKRYDQ